MITGCKKEKGGENEEELITTIKVTLTAQGSTPQIFTWKDVDGPGGNAPQISEIVLAPNKTYACQLEFLDESKTPSEDITAEVLAEAVDHEIYYEPAGVNVAVSNLNKDSKNLPLGTTSTWTTTGVSNGSVKITLKHKPGIKAAGDPVTKGETDIEVSFTTKVQ
jgi:hypothetical protein